MIEELGPGWERRILAFLENDAVRNLRIIWSLRTFGLFNLGLPEQGRVLGCLSGEGLCGVLFADNLGLWRIAAPPEATSVLVEEGMERWGFPEAVAGPEEQVEGILEEFPELRGRVSRKEEEVSLLLEPGRFRPRGGGATWAEEEDLPELVVLEKGLQRELVGSCAAEAVIRRQLGRVLENGGIALVRRGGRVVCKADVEAVTPGADELGGVYTLPPWRGMGFASAACSLACTPSVSRGKPVRLETQRDNRPALALYRGLGFRELWPHLVVCFGGAAGEDRRDGGVCRAGRGKG